MVNRHAFGDLALAILLALPIASLTQFHSVEQKPADVRHSVHVSSAERAPSQGRISLLS